RNYWDRWAPASGKAPSRRHRPYRPRSSFRRYRPHRSCELWRDRLRLLQRDPLFVLVGQVRHVHGDRRPVANLRRRVGNAAAADAIDPVGHVILVFGLAALGLAAGTVRLLGPILQRLFEVMFDGTVTAENAV